MENDEHIRKWSELRGLPVTLPSAGRRVGTLEDLYFKYGTGAIDYLLVNVPIQGSRVVPITGIRTIEPDAIAIINEQTLLSALPPYPRVSELLTSKIADESGAALASVEEAYIGIRLPAMWLIAFDVKSLTGRAARTQRITNSQILHYRPEMVIVGDRDARRLR